MERRLHYLLLLLLRLLLMMFYILRMLPQTPQQAEIEEWKRKYKDMHSLATQAMSQVHEFEKAQEK